MGKDSRIFHIFVALGVQQIRNHTDPHQWQYVSTSENPANIASRGGSVQELITKPIKCVCMGQS